MTRLAVLFALLVTAQAWCDARCITLEEWALIDTSPWTLRRVEQETEHALVVKDRVDYHSLSASIADLREYYQRHGYFSAQLWACIKIVSLEKREVDVVVKIDAGQRATINELRFRGNVHLSRSEIESVMMSHATSALSQLLIAMDYGALQIDEDKARIVELYQSRGYLDARVVAVTIRASDDLSTCDVEVDIEEGNLYRVGEIEPREWQSAISLRPGDIFDLPRLTNEVEAILVPFRDQGYAFAKATPDLTLQKNVLSARYALGLGPRVIVRSVVAKGNTLTQSDVIERDFSDLQGKAYQFSQTEIRRMRLLYKGSVSEAKAILAPTPFEEVYDLEIHVKEKFPMRFNLAPYYLSGEGLILSAYVMHQNLFGRNVFGLLATQISGVRQTFELAFYAPRLANQDISWLTEIHDRQYTYYSFASFSLGGGGRVNFRVNEHLTFGGGLSVDDVNVKPVEDPKYYTDLVTLPSANTKSVLFMSGTIQPLPMSLDIHQLLAFDTKLSYAGPVSLSEIGFAEIAAGIRWGFSLKPFVFRGRLNGAMLFKLGDRLSIADRYFLGGQSNLRGYQIVSVGPFARNSAEAPLIQIGGVKKFVNTIEAEMPIMNFLDMRAYLFSDMGNSYSETQGLFEGGIAASLGLGLTATLWRIPIKCELAKSLVNIPGALGIDIYIGLSSVNW